jgi:polyferredoxin
MTKDKYSKRRRLIQGLAILVLISIPLRFFCFDTQQECIRLFGIKFGLATMFYPLFTIVALLLFVVGIGMKKGRLFCSHICPMHMFLEKVNNPANKKAEKRTLKIWLWALLFSVMLVEVMLSFFQPLERQLELAMEGNLAVIISAAVLFGGLMALFVVYQERFCKKGCPYALIQMLLQSDLTRKMEFANRDRTCTNCRGCDDICPFNLRPRFESISPDCTNCNLCAEACTTELGQGNTLFHLIDPQPEAFSASAS